MRIGIFGGSFDPIHVEHVRLAEEAISSLGLDKLFIMPAAAPPHKKGKRLSPSEDRLQMCSLAFRDNPRVEISNYEIQQSGISYTYLTCRYFKTLFPTAQLFWLVGTDMLRDFPTWKYPESILNDATLAVCARAEQQGWETLEQAEFQRRFHKKFEIIHYNATAISSTQIRVLAGAGMRLTPFVKPEVAAYIEQGGLYTIPYAKDALSLQKPDRAQHSVRVAKAAATVANKLWLSERQAIQAALFHDAAKNIDGAHPLLKSFVLDERYGDVPAPVWHQFAGAYLAEHAFHISDADVLNAIRFHTSGRAGMSALEEIIFLADMLEDARDFDGVTKLRELFYQGRLRECMRLALRQSLRFIESKSQPLYPLTRQAYEFYQSDKGDSYGTNERNE